MNNPESPEQKADVAEARISWAASFLVDWLIPLLQDNQLEDPNEIIQLRREFPPIPVENDKGIDFSIHDVLVAALRWRAYNQQQFPHIPEEAFENGEALHRAIELLGAAVHDPPKSED